MSAATTILKAPSGLVGQITTNYGNYSIGTNGQVTVDSRAVAALHGAGFTTVDTTQGGGAHTVTSAEATATAAVAATGLSTIVSFIVEVYRSGIQVTGDAVITTSGGNITVTHGSTYVVTAGDIIRYVVTGY